MEDKQLNIHQPLLSVRRFSSIAASQKNESRKNRSYLPTRPSVESCKSELKLDPLRNTGSIPFVWEHSPGRPKDETNKQSQTKENPPSLPKLPPGRILKPKKKDLDTKIIKGPTVTNEKTKFESAKSSKKGSSDSGGDDGDDIDDDDAFMDALDTLSRGESSFYNCSASGVSGFGSDLKPSGTLPSDRKLRDFMMDRFLPAAKAMTSEVPQHTSRKHVVKEKPREVKKIVNLDNKRLQLRYGPTFLLDIVHDHEEEDSNYDYDEHGNKSSKLCGLLPRFCTKGSFGLLNPVPGMSMRTRLPMSPATGTHASSSSASSFSKTENEPARIAIYEHRSFDDKSVHYPKLEGSKLYNRLQGCGESFQSIVSENDSCSQKKDLTRFKDLLNEADSQDSVAEKTLYVDTVHMVKSPKENSNASDDIPKISSVSRESLDSDMLADEPKHDKKTEMHTDSWKDPTVDVELLDDRNVKASQDIVFEVPAPPPLPKSPSDSWLWRTLPSVSSKNTRMRWNPKCPESDENIYLRRSQGSLLPIPET